MANCDEAKKFLMDLLDMDMAKIEGKCKTLKKDNLVELIMIMLPLIEKDQLNIMTQTLLEKNDQTLDDKEKSENNSIRYHTPEKETGEKKTHENDIKVCQYYLRGKCKYGRNGKDCKMSHPKVCFKYRKAKNGIEGCKRGKKCHFAHVIFCKRNACDKLKCNTIYHDRIDRNPGKNECSSHSPSPWSNPTKIGSLQQQSYDNGQAFLGILSTLVEKIGWMESCLKRQNIIAS